MMAVRASETEQIAARRARAAVERIGYESAAAAACTIARLSPDFEGEEAVWQAFVASKDDHLRASIQTIRRTRHSIFDHLLQELYEFGMEHLAPAIGEGLCRACGREAITVAFQGILQRVLEALLDGGPVQGPIQPA
ncbi:MAG: hypothetical protein ACYTFT_10610, partial [Planctomycetota bacterium]